jgi:protein O-GlcNAc transferase
MIRSDGIDILVDLSGHTAWNRLPLFTHRAAPIQASWLGYPGTTGLASIDYLVMDEAAVPPGSEHWCSEAVVRLPFGRFCYAPPDYAPKVAPPPSASRSYTTFGSFNNLNKVGSEVVKLWAAVLAAAPRSRLLLKWKTLADPSTRQRFLDAFAAHEIGPERLELRGASPHPRMLAEYGDIDIALDPFPFCGGLTSCEALWMGVPVVTLPSERPASRQTLGFLTTLGLKELAASSETDYVRIAAELAADPARLTELRQSLRPAMAASPLTDGRQFTPTLEAAFRTMWRRWCAGEPAAGFDVGAAAG